MRKIYLLLLLCCIGAVSGYGQATSLSCTPTSSSWTGESSYYAGYGVDEIDITGYLGSTLSDYSLTSLCDGTTGYLDETSAVSAVTFQQGGSYATTLYTLYSSSAQEAQIWIDFNDDGIFDVSEEVTPVLGYTSSYPFYTNINIPVTAATGTHYMRVRGIWETFADGTSLSTDLDPCQINYGGSSPYYYSGDVIDYYCTIVALPTCSGMPTAGAAVSSVTMACPSTSFTVGVSGYVGASDHTYQWLSSTDGGTTWSAISGATGVTYSTTISTPTSYKLAVTCPSAGLSDTSTSVFVNYVGYCYCVPTYEYSPATGYGPISEFTVADYSGTFDDATVVSAPSSGYLDNTIDTIPFQQNGTYSGTIYLGGSYFGNESQVWIDFDNSGTFETSEEVTPVFGDGDFTYPYSDNFTLTIPFSAAPGPHRMRVREGEYFSSPISADMDPCNYYDASGYYYEYGVTVDYVANIVPLPPCSGAPTAGVAHADATLACPGTPFNLSATGMSAASDLAFQWLFSADGTTWSSISGATTTPYSYTTSTAGYYKLAVTCPTSSLSDTSAPVFVNYLGFCYCVPTYYFTPASSYEGFTNITIDGYSGSILNDDGPTSVPASGYEDRTIDTVNFQQGGSYPGTMTYTYSEYDPYSNQIWIDFSDDGVFDASEEVTPVFGESGCGTYASSAGFNIAIPITANPGYHRMRVRNAFYYSCTPSSEMDPCNDYDSYISYYYGLSRDYMVNIVPLPPCTGTPVVGAASITPTSGGSPTVFSLSLPGLAMASGMTYQWQSSTSATGPFTNITGATTPTYTFTGISADEWYQCVVTCTATSSTTTSDTAHAHYVLVPTCTTTSASWTGEGSYSFGADEFDVTGYSGSSLSDVGILSSINHTTGYADHTSMGVTFQQGGTYASSLYFGGYSHQNDGQIWIDFNDNGTYESSEEVSPVVGFNMTSTPYPTIFNISIPITAPTGNHLMRMRGIWELWSTSLGVAPAHMDPCLIDYGGSNPEYLSGSCVDYRINIVAAPPCSGTPSAGGAISSVAMACPSTPFTLSDTGVTVASGLTFQWQSSPDGTTWTNISGATTPTYTYTASAALYYHCVVTCTATSSSASSTSVFVNYVGYCYCVPTYYYSYTGYDITSVNINGYAGSTLSDLGISSTETYVDHTIDTVAFQQNGSYSGTLDYYYSGEYENQVWIDFNNDGNFTTDEEVTPVFGNTSSYISTANFTISIPLTAPTGYHRMRIRNAITYSYGSYSTDMDPCASSDVDYTYYYGSVRDYSVNIIALPPCAGVPAAGTASADAYTACASTTINLSDAGSTSATGLAYQWLASTDGGTTWTAVSGATSLSATVTESVTTEFALKVTCTSAGLSDTSAPVTVHYSSYCYCTPSYTYSPASSSYGMGNLTILGFGGTTINDNGPAVVPASGYEDRTMDTIKFQQGGSYNGTESYTYSYYYMYESQIWIDFDNSGTFETSEEVTPVFGESYFTIPYPSSDAFTISIPTGSDTGYHRMRIRYESSVDFSFSTDMDPCNPYDADISSYDYGTTRDYTTYIARLCPYTISVPASLGPVCPNASFSLSGVTTTATSYSWSGPGGFTSTALAPTVSGISGTSTFTLTVTDGSCATTELTTVLTRTPPPAPTMSPTDTAICSGSSVMLTATALPDTVNLIPVESWESGLPTDPSTTVDGWSTDAAAAYWMTAVTSGVDPTVSSAPDGTHFADFDSYGLSSGDEVSLLSPNFSMVGVTSAQFSFWVYREVGGFYTAAGGFGSEGFNVYLTTTGSISDYSDLIGFVPRAADGTPTGVSGVASPTASGWYQYTVAIPSTATGATNAIIIQGYSQFGDNCFMDDISIRGVYNLAAPTWTPVSTLYTSSALTTGYTAGTPAGTVYALPTPVTTTADTVTYYATVTDGTCSSSDSVHVIVNPGPAISGTFSVCIGAVTTLTDAASGGTWSSTDTSVAVVDASGHVTGHASGTTTISYVLPTGCFATQVVTVLNAPAPIGGSSSVCVGSTITLTDATGAGTWAGSGGFATVGSATGSVMGSSTGTEIVTFTLTSTGCTITTPITVNPTPTTITGTSTVCEGYTTTLYDGLSLGTWSTTSGLGTIDPVSGVVTAGTTGSGTMPITYTVGTCSVTGSVTITVPPTPIVGLVSVCPGNTITLSEGTPGGTWSSTGDVTVDPSTGIVTGGSTPGGSGTVSVTVPGGCSTSTSITVNLLPSPISGSSGVCLLGTTVLSDASAPGTWASAPSATASIDAGGTVTGNAVGTATITFTSLATGCSITTPITVSPAPSAITSATGTFVVCTGSSLILSDATGGGTWSSSAGSVASVTGGLVVGMSAGATTINYSVSGCAVSATVTVDDITTPSVTLSPGPGVTVCAGSGVTLTATPTNGGPSPLYQWVLNGGTISGVTTPTYSYTPTSGDIMYVTMTSSNPCSSPSSATSTTDTIYVDLITAPVGTILATPGTPVTAGGADSFLCNVTGGAGAAPTYQWEINGVPVSGATNAAWIANTPSPLGNGDIVSCVVTNTDMCGSSTNISFASPIEVWPVGVNNVNGTKGFIAVMPNPNNGTFSIKGNLGVVADEDVHMVITDMLGQVVYNDIVRAKAGEIDQKVIMSTTAANGMYLLEVKSEHISGTFHFVLEQ